MNIYGPLCHNYMKKRVMPRFIFKTKFFFSLRFIIEVNSWAEHKVNLCFRSFSKYMASSCWKILRGSIPRGNLALCFLIFWYGRKEFLSKIKASLSSMVPNYCYYKYVHSIHKILGLQTFFKLLIVHSSIFVLVVLIIFYIYTSIMFLCTLKIIIDIVVYTPQLL